MSSELPTFMRALSMHNLLAPSAVGYIATIARDTSLLLRIDILVRPERRMANAGDAPVG